jgi:hypothetical protein
MEITEVSVRLNEELIAMYIDRLAAGRFRLQDNIYQVTQPRAHMKRTCSYEPVQTPPSLF